MKKWIPVLVMVLLIASVPIALAEGSGTQPTQIDLTPLFQAAITLLAALITVKVIPWITARTTAQQRELMLATVRTLVFAAEQMFGSNQGQEKLAYVEREMQRRGYTVDRDAIEATVRDMNLWASDQNVKSDVPTATEMVE